MPSEIIHEQLGLKIRRNANNRFVVCELDYFADPAKRSPEWAAEARSGMSAAAWAKEYLRDATAMYGQRVFPEIAAHRDKIVINPPFRDFGPQGAYWGGFDFGSRNPSAFIVYTLEDGVLYAIWELYEPCKTIPDLAAKIISCPYYNHLRYVACDPTIVNQKTRTNKYGALVTISDLLGEYGIKRLIPGHTDETVWLQTMRRHWADPSDPTFRILDSCPNLIHEFENAVFASQNEKQVLTETYREQIEDVHNHALDATKYLMNSKPTVNFRRFRDPQMARRWLH
jgi:hypothetical protein